MAPKKRQTPEGVLTNNKRKISKPVGTGKKRGRKPKNQKALEMQAHQTSGTNEKAQEGLKDSSDRINETKSLVLGRKNKLDALLSSSQQSKKGPTRNRNKKQMVESDVEFEEDEGFVYQRSQKNVHLLHTKSSDTLISRLKEETEGMIQDQRRLEATKLRPKLYSLDIRRSTEKHSSASQRVQSIESPEPGNLNYNRNTTPSYQEQHYVQLSSPIDSSHKNGENFEDSSNEYKEEVSHHRLHLTDPEYGGPNGNLNPLKGRRRSSYHNRGKRVLSIGNGYMGVPHEDVPTRDFYKLVDSSLPEPQRMRQLLIWCLNRNLDLEERENKTVFESGSTEDQTVINIAKVIKEELLQDLITGNISTSWYNKEDSEEGDLNFLLLKDVILPNPLNISNEENMEIFKKKLNSIIHEKEDWITSYESKIKPLSDLKLKSSFQDEELKDYCATRSRDQNTPDFEGLLPSPGDATESRFKEIIENFGQNLEKSVDLLFSTVHQMTQAKNLIERLIQKNLNPKASALVGNYMLRTQREKNDFNNANLSSRKKFITIDELLKGVARIDSASFQTGINLSD